MDDDLALRIAVLGAGPVGLEAALYGRYLGYVVTLFEPRDVCAGIVNNESPMGSPFRENCTPLGLAALDAQNAEYQHPPAEVALSVDQWANRYCLPLSQTDLVKGTLRIGAQVESIEFLPADETYILVARLSDGSELTQTCDYVIDTRASWPMGEGNSQPEFAVGQTDDFFVITSNGSGSFRRATEEIRQVYAAIGERDELDLYATLKQFEI